MELIRFGYKRGNFHTILNWFDPSIFTGFCYKAVNFAEFISRERLSGKVATKTYTFGLYLVIRAPKKEDQSQQLWLRVQKWIGEQRYWKWPNATDTRYWVASELTWTLDFDGVKTKKKSLLISLFFFLFSFFLLLYFIIMRSPDYVLWFS